MDKFETILFTDLVNVTDQFYDPSDLAFDSQGNLYVCDYFHNRVLMFAIDNRPCDLPSTGNIYS